MNIRPILRHRLRECLVGLAAFLGVMLVLALLSIVLAWRLGEGAFGFGGFGAGCTALLLIYGILSIREDARLCLQCGVSRRTAYLAGQLAALTTAVLVAVVGEGLTAAMQALVGGRGDTMVILDAYQLLFTTGGAEASLTLSLPEHLLSILFQTLLLMAWFTVGQLFSLLFFRLNKFWTIVVALALPLLAAFGLPWAVFNLELPLMNLGRWLLASAGNCMAFSLGLAALCAVLGWLLLRRAPMRATGK